MANKGTKESRRNRTGLDLRSADLPELMSHAPGFEGLSPDVLAEVVDACEVVDIAGDDQLLRRDVPNDSLYMVSTAGCASSSTTRSAASACLDAIGATRSGSPAGPGASAAIDVVAIRDSVLLRLTRARFAALGERHPELVMRLAETIARRGLSSPGPGGLGTWTRRRASARKLALLVPTRDPYFARAAADLAARPSSATAASGTSRASPRRALGEGASTSRRRRRGNGACSPSSSDLERRTTRSSTSATRRSPAGPIAAFARPIG